MENDGDDGSNPMLDAMRRQMEANQETVRLKVDLGRAYQALSLMMYSAQNGRKTALKEEIKVLQSIIYDIGAGINAIEEE